MGSPVLSRAKWSQPHPGTFVKPGPVCSPWWGGVSAFKLLGLYSWLRLVEPSFNCDLAFFWVLSWDSGYSGICKKGRHRGRHAEQFPGSFVNRAQRLQL